MKGLSPEAGVGFGPEAAGAEERPVKLKWLFVSISAEGRKGIMVNREQGLGLPARRAPGLATHCWGPRGGCGPSTPVPGQSCSL